MQFDQGYSSPYFVSDTQRMEAVVEKPAILITDKKIGSMKEIMNLLEAIASTGKKDIVIIAEDIEGEALASLVLNKIRGVLNVLTVKAPGFGDRKKEMLQDIATVTGGTVVTEELGLKLEEVGVEVLGHADKVIATKDNTVIVDGKGDEGMINERANQIKAQISHTTSDYDREKLQERLAKLVGGVAVIKVGAATEMEMKNKKFKIEDALNATRAAVEEGIVTGGGTALVKLSKILDDLHFDDADENIAIQIVKSAIQYPVIQIANNAGHKGDWVVEKVKESDQFNHGFDARVAVSTAAMFLTTDAVIVDEPKKDDCCGGSCSAGAGM